MKKLKLRKRSHINYDFDENYVRDYNYKLIDSNGSVVGEANGILVGYSGKDELYISPRKLFRIADAISQDFLDATETLLQLPDDTFTFCNSYFYLDRIKISEKYRNNGLGSQFLQMIKKDLYNKVDILYLTIAPTEIREEGDLWDSIKNRLERFYNRNGFLNLSSYGSSYVNNKLTIAFNSLHVPAALQ